MDYPISVPGVGLVDGKFVDEDQLSGTPGSLIPAGWGNAVTDEILGVQQEAGIAPVEGNNGQLRASILAIALNVVRSAAAKATELVRGAMRVGTQAEVNAGALDDVAVTPAKLRFGFLVSLALNGYIVFPTWMGSLIIQWGHGLFDSNKDMILPIAFTTTFFSAVVSDRLSTNPIGWDSGGSTLSKIRFSSAVANETSSYIAIGK